jgi:hypothetical protein
MTSQLAGWWGGGGPLSETVAKKILLKKRFMLKFGKNVEKVENFQIYFTF